MAKTKALISFAVTAKLICVFVFAYAKRWFSHDAALMHSHRLIRAFILHYLGSIMLLVSKIQNFCNCTGWFESNLVGNLIYRFFHEVAKMYPTPISSCILHQVTTKG